MMTGVRAFWLGDRTQVASGLCCTGAVAVQAERARASSVEARRRGLIMDEL